MDSMDAARKLEQEFSVDWSEARKAVEAEADTILQSKPRRVSYADAIEAGYTSVRGWLQSADEYVISLEWKDLAKFQSSHRPACVWAVLTGKALRICARCAMDRDHYFHKSSAECAAKGECRAPDDHHEFTLKAEVTA